MTDPAPLLEELGAQINDMRRRLEEKSRHSEPPAREPLTTVFDEWHEEIRERDKETGRLAVELRIAVVLILGSFIVLINWLWPTS